jgi:hypothetical protein
VDRSVADTLDPVEEHMRVARITEREGVRIRSPRGESFGDRRLQALCAQNGLKTGASIEASWHAGDDDPAKHVSSESR